MVRGPIHHVDVLLVRVDAADGAEVSVSRRAGCVFNLSQVQTGFDLFHQMFDCRFFFSIFGTPLVTG